MFDTDILWDQEEGIESQTASTLTDILTSFGQKADGCGAKPWPSIAEGKLLRLTPDGDREIEDRSADADRDMWKGELDCTVT